jgi:hypothetical protein
MLIVAMDANFRLRSKLRAASTKDPSMGLGLAYFVDHQPYAEFIKGYVDQDEVSPLLACCTASCANVHYSNRSVLAWASKRS